MKTREEVRLVLSGERLQGSGLTRITSCIFPCNFLPPLDTKMVIRIGDQEWICEVWGHFFEMSLAQILPPWVFIIPGTQEEKEMMLKAAAYSKVWVESEVKFI